MSGRETGRRAEAGGSMPDVRHRVVHANGIRMHVAEAGQGVPVVMCHGWPELWYSWRHQLTALAAAGFRAIAPDMRGYGETDAPADPAAYRTTVICADILGLLDALELERAVIVGHDWGGYHLWQFGLRHPERCAKLVGLNTPYAPPGPVPPTQALRERFGEDGYYMLWHQRPGRSEAELEADLRGNLAKIFKGVGHARDLWTMATLGGDGSGLFARVPEEGGFLTDAELDVYVRAFAADGDPRVVQLVPGARPELGGRPADRGPDDPRARPHDHGRERPHPPAGPGRADADVDPRSPHRADPPLLPLDAAGAARRGQPPAARVPRRPPLSASVEGGQRLCSWPRRPAPAMTRTAGRSARSADLPAYGGGYSSTRSPRA